MTGRARSGLALGVVLLAGACASSDRMTTPTTPPVQGNNATACAGGGTVRLAPFEAATLDCSAGTTVTLAGGGASYLVVPNLASGAPLANVLADYSISASGAASVADVLPLPDASAALESTLAAWSRPPSGPRPGAYQASFDAALRALAARKLAAGEWRRGAVAPGARASVDGSPPAVGSLRTFHVLSSFDGSSYRAVAARLEYAGTNILLYEDTLAPPNGFTTDQIAQFAHTFDQVLYPVDVSAFGPPSDIDQNGRLIMLLTPVVNALTPAATCDTQGYVAGYFTGNDLVNGDSTSNGGELFYAMVPDPGATVSCAHSVATLQDELGATFLHELQHLISFSQHVLVRNSAEEEGWLDEGLSLVAEELGSLYYEAKYPAPAGRTSAAQLFPDSAEGYISGVLETSYSYLLRPDTATLTLHSDDESGLAWRGGDWLLLRWLGDQHGGTGFFRALDQTGLTGIANIEHAAGEPFPSLFGDFSLALYADSLPGVARGQVPAPDRFTTRDLRQIYAALYRVAGPSAQVPYRFPVQLTPLSATAVTASLAPGTMGFYRLDSSAAAPTVTVTFAAPGGGPLRAALHPQVSILRLPPGQ